MRWPQRGTPPAEEAKSNMSDLPPNRLAVSATHLETPQLKRILLIAMGVLLLIGTGLRITRMEPPRPVGFDERYYVMYTQWHATHSVTEFDNYCAAFYQTQLKSPVGIPSPMRLLYPYAAMLVQKATGFATADSLLAVSILSAILLLVFTAIIAARMFGMPVALGVTALTVVGFNQLHQTQGILVDCVIAVLTLWALWSLWELGRSPRKWGFWLLYCTSMLALVFVKESAFLIYCGIAAVIVLGKPLRLFEHPPKYALVATVGCGAIAFSILCWLCGGFERFFDIYMAVVDKSLKTPYVIQMGDGPWYRYIVDSMLAQPLITIFAIAGIMQFPFTDVRVRFWCVFMAITFAMMSQVKYAQFFRYSIIWDLPLRLLVVFQIAQLAKQFVPQRASLVVMLSITLISFHEFSRYWKTCVLNHAYALETIELIVNQDFYRPNAP
jgi:hypothetical protein